MSKILVVAEHLNGELNAGLNKVLNCAKSIGGDVDVLVLADKVADIAGAAALVDGVSRVLTIERAENAHPLSAVLAPQIVAVAGDGYSHVLVAGTTFGKDLMPRVAALMGVQQVSDIMAVHSASSFDRPIYAGNAIVTVDVPSAPLIAATVRLASFKSVGEQAAAGIEATSVDAALPTHSRFVGLDAAKGDRPDLQGATTVVSGGRALGSSENFDVIYKFADKIGAGVGASRAAVDSGYVPNDMQVGQTGKIIAPDLYFAIGISGAIQHLAGIKDAGTIVAINKDEEAPIFEVADIGLVGDLFDVVPELTDKL